MSIDACEDGAWSYIEDVASAGEEPVGQTRKQKKEVDSMAAARGEEKIKA